jgi:hypothetical protein
VCKVVGFWQAFLDSGFGLGLSPVPRRNCPLSVRIELLAECSCYVIGYFLFREPIQQLGSKNRHVTRVNREFLSKCIEGQHGWRVRGVARWLLELCRC